MQPLSLRPTKQYRIIISTKLVVKLQHRYLRDVSELQIFIHSYAFMIIGLSYLAANAYLIGKLINSALTTHKGDFAAMSSHKPL